jgi:tRNA 5-methylaminomethyl-2-thiouridine biosynthesis bifunctional protein
VPTPAWQGQSSWRILDTDFAQGGAFLQTCLAWQQDPDRPRLLHYVGVLSAVPGEHASTDPSTQALRDQLAPFTRQLQPGFQRLELAHPAGQGLILLTLCVGPLLEQLNAMQFKADAVLCTPHINWDRWTFKALARCCRRHTLFDGSGVTEVHRAALQECGFELEESRVKPGNPGHLATGLAANHPGDLAAQSSAEVTHGQYNPGWVLKHSRQPVSTAQQPGACTVVGAGLAGAAVAHALAKRGWQVQVIDAADQAAAGASSLPVGLALAHQSRDDSPRSRLSRAGLRMTLALCERLLRHGVDWQATGVMDRVQNLWHGEAAWIKPHRLVSALLAHPGIRFCGGTRVSAVQAHHGTWQLLTDQGETPVSSGPVFLATALGTVELLGGLPGPAITRLHGMRGQVSWGLHEPSDDRFLPPHPVNGSGSLIPGIPVSIDTEGTDQGGQPGRAWYLGATYESQDAQPAAQNTHHAHNRERLKTLLSPDEFKFSSLEQQFVQARVRAWTGTRCVTADRLPVVGPLNHGSLWVCSAMGSRGLTFAPLCAELLAAQLAGEPWPVEARLARSLSPRRGSGA